MCFRRPSSFPRKRGNLNVIGSLHHGRQPESVGMAAQRHVGCRAVVMVSVCGFCGFRLPFKPCHGFDVCGVREQVEYAGGAECVTFADQHGGIACQRGGIARYIHDALWQIRRVQALHHGQCAGARRVEQHFVETTPLRHGVGLRVE